MLSTKDNVYMILEDLMIVKVPEEELLMQGLSTTYSKEQTMSR